MSLFEFVGDVRHQHIAKDPFQEKDLVSKEPMAQFKAWYENARDNDQLEPCAMCVSTVNKDGIPSARMVLLKEFSKEGFKFFTHYGSSKGKDIDQNPNVSVTFYWASVDRSVRIQGVAEKLPEDENERFFHSRPVDSQVAANACPQTEPLESRAVLEARFQELTREYSGKTVPKPKDWGGYLIRPSSVEFWQGHMSRLSDRIRFRRASPSERVDGKLLKQGEEGWVYETLYP